MGHPDARLGFRTAPEGFAGLPSPPSPRAVGGVPWRQRRPSRSLRTAPRPLPARAGIVRWVGGFAGASPLPPPPPPTQSRVGGARVSSSAPSPAEEAEHLPCWRGPAPGGWLWASPFLKGMNARVPEKSLFIGVCKHPETPGSCLCLGQSYSIKIFAVLTSSLVTVNNRELHFTARYKQQGHWFLST